MSHEIRIDGRNFARLIQLCHALRDTAPVVTFNDALDYLFEQAITNEDLVDMYEHEKFD